MLKSFSIKYMARRQYQSSLDQINSFREFLAFLLVYIRLHPTVDGKLVLHQYHQIILSEKHVKIIINYTENQCID
jgi:hypothetical protein